MFRTAGLFLIIVAALCAEGCSNPNVLVLTNFAKSYGSVAPDSVRITTELPQTPPYLEIGYIYMQDEKLDNVLSLSRKRAAEVGGDAIMNARVGINVTQVGSILSFPIFDQSYFVRGIVVKRKQPQ